MDNLRPVRQVISLHEKGYRTAIERRWFALPGQFRKNAKAPGWSRRSMVFFSRHGTVVVSCERTGQTTGAEGEEVLVKLHWLILLGFGVLSFISFALFGR